MNKNIADLTQKIQSSNINYEPAVAGAQTIEKSLQEIKEKNESLQSHLTLWQLSFEDLKNKYFILFLHFLET